HRLHLLDDVDAVGVAFEHALDAFDVARNALHAPQSFFLAGLHGTSPIPPHGGWDRPILLLNQYCVNRHKPGGADSAWRFMGIMEKCARCAVDFIDRASRTFWPAHSGEFAPVWVLHLRL